MRDLEAKTAGKTIGLQHTLDDDQLVVLERVAFGVEHARFEIDMQRCPNCSAVELKIIAAILERPVIEKILSCLGLDPQPPPKGRASEAGPHFAA